MPEVFVKAEIFKGSITKIGMGTKHPEETYIYTRQHNGTYTRQHNEAGKVTDEAGSFTLDDIANRIQLYDEAKSDAPMTLRLIGNTQDPKTYLPQRINSNQQYPTNAAGMEALAPHLKLSKAIAQVGNEKVAQQYKAALAKDTDVFDRINDAIMLYNTATNFNEQATAIMELVPELTNQKEISGFPALFRKHPGLSKRLQDVFQNERDVNPEQQAAAMGQVWLDDFTEANNILAKQDKEAKHSRHKAR